METEGTWDAVKAAMSLLGLEDGITRELSVGGLRETVPAGVGEPEVVGETEEGRGREGGEIVRGGGRRERDREGRARSVGEKRWPGKR